MDKLLYERDREALMRILSEMKNDGWTKEDVEKYFYLLGYDIFFIKSALLLFDK